MAPWLGPNHLQALSRGCNQGELPPSYILGRSHSHLPCSKHGHSYLTYPWNQLKVIDVLMTVLGVICKTVGMQNNSMALLHVCHPPVQACGGEDTLYFYYFLGSLSSGCHYKSLWGGADCTLLQGHMRQWWVQSPVGVHTRGNWLTFFSLSFSLPSPLSKNKKIKINILKMLAPKNNS